MVHVRGARSDYAEWVKLGAEGWGWDDVLPIFLRMEHFDGGASELHGVGGPTSIVSRYALAPVHEAIMAAAQEVGIARNDDYNSGDLDGVAQTQLTIRHGGVIARLPPTCGRSSTRPICGSSLGRRCADCW
jgi:choline dehydrogenase